MSGSLGTSYDAAEQSPGLLLWQVTNHWQAAIRAALRPYGVTHVQFVLLASLTWLGDEGPVTQKRLAEHAAADPMMTSQVLRALEARGLVQREVHPDDRRAKALAVTPSGRDLANATIGVVEECDRQFFATLGREEAVFTRTLAALAGRPRALTSSRRRT